MESLSEIFYIMSQEMMNKMCIDCKKPYPLFASITNGVFICEECSLTHRSMGIHISYVRSLKDEWDEYLLSYMRRGGNKRFLKCMEDYNVNEDSDIGYKYRTRAIENYRSVLKSEVLAEEPPEIIEKSEGNQLSANLEFNPYPEFENYQILSEEEEIKCKEDNEHNKNFLQKVGSFFKVVGKNVGETAESFNHKIKEMELGKKIKHTSKKAYVVMKSAGGFVVQNSKPLVEKIKVKAKEGFETISEKTKEGTSKLAHKTKEVFSDIKTKFNKNNQTIKGEAIVSEYYELKSQNENENILNYIDNNGEKNKMDTEKENLNSQNFINSDSIPIGNEDSGAISAYNKKDNSFTLFNNNSLNQENDTHENSFPTLNELQKAENDGNN